MVNMFFNFGTETLSVFETVTFSVFLCVLIVSMCFLCILSVSQYFNALKLTLMSISGLF